MRGVIALALRDALGEQAAETAGISEGRGVKGLLNLANLLEPVNAREQAAETAGISGETLRKVAVVENTGSPELRAAAATG